MSRFNYDEISYEEDIFNLPDKILQEAKDGIVDPYDKEINEGTMIQGNYKPEVFTGKPDDHEALGWYFRCNGQIWKTFYLNYHQGYKQMCIWCTCESKTSEIRTISRVISLTNFMENYLSNAKRSKDELSEVVHTN